MGSARGVPGAARIVFYKTRDVAYIRPQRDARGRVSQAGETALALARIAV